MSDKDKTTREPDDQILAGIEDMLATRADQGSELPWLRVSVMSQVEAREKARQWLNDNGSLFEARDNTPRGAKRSLVFICHLIMDMGGMMRNIRIWSTLGAMVAGGGLGYFSATYLHTHNPAATAASMAAIATAAGVFAAGAAVQWPYLREYYS